MKTTFSQLMTSGARLQQSVMGEPVEHVPVDGVRQSLTALVRLISLIDRDVTGEIVEVTTAILTFVEADFNTLVTRQSKFIWCGPSGEIQWNFDDQSEMRRHACYLDVPVWSPVHVRKGPDGFRRELM